MLGPLLNSFHMKHKLYIRDLKFIHSLANSHNSLARSCFTHVYKNANSVIGNKIAYFRDQFDVNICQRTLKNNIRNIQLSTVITDDDQSIIDHIWSLILVKSNHYSVEGFDLGEINDIIAFLATS